MGRPAQGAGGHWGSPLGRPALTSRRAVTESRAGGGGGHNQKVKKRPGCQERPGAEEVLTFQRPQPSRPLAPSPASAPSCRSAVIPLLSTRPAFCIREGVCPGSSRPHARKIHSSLTQGVPRTPSFGLLTTLSNPSGERSKPGLKSSRSSVLLTSPSTQAGSQCALGEGGVPKGSPVAGCG